MSTNLLEQLTLLLKEDIKSTNTLLAYLNEEKELLIKCDFSHLTDLAQKKQTITDIIEQNNKKKITLLSPLNQNGKLTGLLEVLVADYGQEKTDQLKSLNKVLEKQLSEIRQQNAVNGQAIVKSLENNQTLIDIVIGKTQKNELYNALGQSTDNQLSKSYHQKV